MPIQSQVLTASHSEQKTVNCFESNMSYFPDVEAPLLAMSLHFSLTPLTIVCVRTGTVKLGALSIPNLPTYPSIETRIGAAAPVVASMPLRNVFVSTLQ